MSNDIATINDRFRSSLGLCGGIPFAVTVH
jgi:hypothetical protein